MVRQLQAQVKWGCHKFDISKLQWESTAIPKLTYANTVTVMNKATQKAIEKAQYDAGKWALGIANYKAAEEFAQGELGWKTLRQREALSKIKYYTRMRFLPETRWLKAVVDMVDILKLKISAIDSMKELYEDLNCEDIHITMSVSGHPLLGQYFKEVKKRISEVEVSTWELAMSKKSSLEVYRAGQTKSQVGKDMYDEAVEALCWRWHGRVSYRHVPGYTSSMLTWIQYAQDVEWKRRQWNT